MSTVAQAGERALIARLRERFRGPRADVVVGIGDDAAVVEPPRGRQQALTTDTLVEGVHFDLRFCRPGDVGHKALAVNVSDLAAMGA
jgi:thiamine-monophosphate kinase